MGVTGWIWALRAYAEDPQVAPGAQPDPAAPGAAAPAAAAPGAPAAAAPGAPATPADEVKLPPGGSLAPFAALSPAVTGGLAKVAGGALKRVVVSATVDGAPAPLVALAAQVPVGGGVKLAATDSGWIEITPASGASFPEDVLPQVLQVVQFRSVGLYQGGEVTLRYEPDQGSAHVETVKLATGGSGTPPAVGKMRVKPKIGELNFGSQRNFYAWAPARLVKSHTAQKIKGSDGKCSLDVRVDVDGRPGRWYAHSPGTCKVKTGSTLDLFEQAGLGIDFEGPPGTVERRQVEVQAWVANPKSEALAGFPGHREGERPLGGPVLLNIGWENRNRFTLSAVNVPAAVGITMIPCQDILDAADGTGNPLGEPGTLARHCSDQKGQGVVGTSSAKLAPAGVQLRFAPTFGSDTFGFFADARVLELGANGFTSPKTPEDNAVGLLSVGSLGLGTDARFTVSDNTYSFFLRGGVTGLLVNQVVRPRPLFEAGLTIPIVSTSQKAPASGTDTAKDAKAPKSPKDPKAPKPAPAPATGGNP